jgi:Arc/MetJ-type ribon-helix-helix transcriptional regulator
MYDAVGGDPMATDMISVRLNPDLISEIDSIGQVLDRNRSEIIRLGLDLFAEAYPAKKLQDLMTEAAEKLHIPRKDDRLLDAFFASFATSRLREAIK